MRVFFAKKLSIFATYNIAQYLTKTMYKSSVKSLKLILCSLFSRWNDVPTLKTTPIYKKRLTLLDKYNYRTFLPFEGVRLNHIYHSNKNVNSLFYFVQVQNTKKKTFD